MTPPDPVYPKPPQAFLMPPLHHVPILILALGVSVVPVPKVHSAEVNWAGEAFSDIAQVSGNGTLVEAKNLGSGTSVDVFSAVAAAQYTSSGVMYSDASLYTGPTIVGLSASQTSDLLDTLEFGPGGGNSVFRLTGLAVGTTYEVQALVSDQRTSGAATAVGYAAVPGGAEVYPLTDQPVGLQAMIFTGTFTADLDSQELHFATRAGSNAQVAAFQIRVVPPPLGIDFLFADPAPLPAPGAATLRWAVTGATAISLDGGPFSGQDVTGLTEISTGPLAATTTFTLGAVNSSGSVVRQVTVAVDPVPSDPVISEFLASNQTVLADGDGDFEDWIEIHNPNPYDFSLAGWHLTDSAGDPTRWGFPAISVPAGGYLVVFASNKNRRVPGAELHTGFRLAASGEYLALTRPDGSVAAEFSPAFPVQIADFSYGPAVGGSAYFAPTPGSANGAPLADLPPIVTAVTENPPQPVAGSDLPIVVALTPTVGAPGPVTLRYRVGFGAEVALAMFDDGAHGDGAAGDGVYGVSIPASAYSAGDMVRWYVTASSAGGLVAREPRFDQPGESPEYFGTVVADPGVATPLPVLHWFVQDTSASETRIGTQASLFYDGRFYDNVFCRTRGQSAGSWPKHKFKFDFYKGGHFQWDPAQPEVEEFNLQSFYREMFTQSSNTSYMREPLMYWWLNEAGAEASHAFHMHVRRNGSFYGLFAFIEQVDEEYLERRGYSKDGAMYKAFGTLAPNPQPGQYRKVLRETEPFTDLAAFCAGINVSNPDRFTYVWDHVDVAQWINVMAAMNVPFNHDQLTKNYYVYLDPGSDEWHRFPWDADQSFPVGQYITFENWTNPRYGDTQHTQELAGGNPNPAWQNHMHDAIMDNPVTREMYMRRVKNLADAYLAGTYFEDMVAATKALIEADADADRAEWASKGVALSDIDAGVNEILGTALPMRRTHLFTTYAAGGPNPELPGPEPSSPAIAFGAIEYNPAGGDQDQEYIEIVNPESSAVDLSGWTVSGGVSHTLQPGTVVPSAGSLYLSPDVIAFRARTVSPKAGENRFVQGNYSGHISNFGEQLVLKNAAGATVATITTPFDPTDVQRYLVVSEIMYHPAADPDAEFVELMNISDAVTLDLAGVKFTSGIDYTFPAGSTLAPGSRVVVNFSDFENLSRLANGGERIKLEDATGSTVRDFSYDDVSPWPAAADGGGPSLVLVAPGSNPDHSAASNWRPSTAAGGNPGGTDAVAFSGDPNLDGDGDSMDAFLEHGFGSSDSAPGPVPLVVALGAGGELLVNFPRNLAADDVRTDIEVSGDLATWAAPAAAPTLVSVTQVGGGVQSETWSVAGGAVRRFVRLVARPR